MDEKQTDSEEIQPLYVSLILDESGSMQSCKRAAIAGFNQYLKSLQDEPAPTWFTLTVFNSRRTEVRYHGVPVATVPELDVETYRPQDTTPLYDAIGQTLAAARKETPDRARGSASFSLTAWRTPRRSSHGSRFTRSSKTASRKGGGLSIWAPITTSGRPAKIWASPKSAASPFPKRASGKRSISSQP